MKKTALLAQLGTISTMKLYILLNSINNSVQQDGVTWTTQLVMQGIWARRHQPRLGAVQGIAVSGRGWWNSLPVPFTMGTIVVVLLIQWSTTNSWGVESLNGEKHLPRERDGAPFAAADARALAAKKHQGESDEPQEEGGASSSHGHGHRAGGRAPGEVLLCFALLCSLDYL
jgi:hypothetical protein